MIVGRKFALNFRQFDGMPACLVLDNHIGEIWMKFS